MKAILPILAALPWLWLSAAASGQALPSGSTATASPEVRPPTPETISGDQLLADVSRLLANQPSVAAKVRERVDLLGHAILGSGIYLQQGRGAERFVRLDLTLQTAGEPSLLQHVCDGQSWWLFRQVGDRKEVGQIDLARLTHARPKSNGTFHPDLLVPLGGLPKLVSGLRDAFQFGPATRSQLDKLPVWALEGTWKPATLARLLPDQKGAIESGSRVTLRPNMPDRAVVYVGCDDAFPYRFEYWRQDPNREPASTAERGRLLMVMELYEVRLGGLVDQRHFSFQPQGIEPVDRTPEFLERFGLEETLPAGATRPRGPRR